MAHTIAVIFGQSIIINDTCAMCGYSDDGNWDAGTEPVIWCKNRKSERFCSYFCKDLFQDLITNHA